MISLKARLIKSVIRLYTYPYRLRHKSLTRSIKIKADAYKPPNGWKFEKIICGGIGVEVLTPNECREDFCIVQFHGGGHTMGMNNYHHKIAERYARITKSKIYSIDYKIGKELRHPSMLDDCYNAYVGLLDYGVNPDDIIAVGDSMGANLMLAVCFRLRDNKIPLPTGLIAISPYIDLSASGLSYRFNCHRDPMYSLPIHQKFKYHENDIRRKTPYAEGCDLKDPYLSPFFGEFENLPPLMIQCGSYEIIESDSSTLYRKALKAENDVFFYEYKGMFHNFQYLAPFLKESKDAWNDILKFINYIKPANLTAIISKQ